VIFWLPIGFVVKNESILIAGSPGVKVAYALN
jgi:hypothetical protein